MYSYVSNPGSGPTYGLYSYVYSSGTGATYGVYSALYGGNGYAGYFYGDMHVSGTVSLLPPTPSPTQKSTNINNAIAKLKGIQTLAFSNEKARTEYTLDVQSLKTSMPELVYEVEQPAPEPELQEGEMPSENLNAEPTIASAINYNGLIPVLLEAIKELEAKVEMLENRIKEGE